MSKLDNVFARSQKGLLKAGHSDDFVVETGTSAGKVFKAVINVDSPIIMEADIGPDFRMQSVLHILPPAPDFAPNDTIRNLDGGVRWNILKRENNDASVTVGFWVEQII